MYEHANSFAGIGDLPTACYVLCCDTYDFLIYILCSSHLQWIPAYLRFRIHSFTYSRIFLWNVYPQYSRKIRPFAQFFIEEYSIITVFSYSFRD